MASLALPRGSALVATRPSALRAAAVAGRAPAARRRRFGAAAAPRMSLDGALAGLDAAAAVAPAVVGGGGGGASTLAAAYEFGGSYNSLYATLFLYAISFPGLWSTIKRAAKVALVQQTYEFPGESAADGRPMRDVAADVMAYMTANNYEVSDAGETITFKGLLQASKGQAAFLTFVTLICLGSLALVLEIQVPSVGGYWWGLTLLSPLAGAYYWAAASANEEREFKVKLTSSDDDMETLMILRGGKEDVERMEKEMDLRQQGMIKVKGVFE